MKISDHDSNLIYLGDDLLLPLNDSFAGVRRPQTMALLKPEIANTTRQTLDIPADYALKASLQLKLAEYGLRTPEQRSHDVRFPYKTMILAKVATANAGSLEVAEIENYVKNKLGDRFDSALFNDSLCIVENYIGSGGVNVAADGTHRELPDIFIPGIPALEVIRQQLVEDVKRLMAEEAMVLATLEK